MSPRKRRSTSPQQLDLAALLPRLDVDLNQRAKRGITIRLKGEGVERRGGGAGAERRSAELPQEPPSSPLTSAPAPAPVVYSGIRVINGRVIREGRHGHSEWNYVGLAGAVPRHVYEYPADVVLERRADTDGVVRLLPVLAGPGEALHELEYAVVDVETTGAGFALGHRVTEVAIVTLNGAGHILDDYTTLVNPERPIPASISALTHITGSMVRRAPTFREIARDVHERLAGRIFVAHNAGFDWGFLSRELWTALGDPLRGRLLCTVRMARALVPEMPRRSLDALSWYFGIENEARHRAFGDARATADLFVRLQARIRERAITGWNELQKVLYARSPRRVRRSTPHSFDPLA